MSLTALQEVNASLKTKSEAMVNLLDKMDGEKSPSETQLGAWQDELTGIEGEMKSLNEQKNDLERRETLRGNAKNLIAQISEPTNRVPFSSGNPESRGDQRALFVKSFGESFLENPQVKDWLGDLTQGGTVPMVSRGQGVKIQSPRSWMEGVGFKALTRNLPEGLDPNAYKALVTGAGSTTGGPFVNTDYLGLLDPDGTFQRPLRIRDLVRVIPTTSDTVEYPRIGTHTNAAAPVAEATATGGSSGAKPESTLVTSTVTETIKTIAHWIPATRRALSDAPMLRALIDAFLRYGLAEELEDQMISGSGSGENFTGALNTSGTTAQAFDGDLLTTYRKARTKVLITGRATPTAYVIHPNDWEDLDLLVDNEARYYLGGPQSVGTPRLWGVPVVESEAMTEGTAMVADWRLAVLFDRMQTAIYVSDSHSDFFTRNLIAILAELRAAFGIVRPAAFVEIALA